MSDAAAIPATETPTVAAESTPLRRNRGFVLFWTGQSVSQLGDQVTALALPLIAVATLHVSAFDVSLLTTMSWLPAIFGAVAGTWIDRSPHQRVLMIGADLGRALVLFSLPAAVLIGHVTLLHLYLVAVLAGAISVVFNTSYSAFFARLVPRESYVAANSRLSISRSAADVAGPAVGGTLVQALGAPAAVLADAVSFLASAAFIWHVRLPGPERATETSSREAPRSFRRELKEGWTFVTRDPILRASLAGTTTINFFTFLAGTGLLVLFATRTLGLSAATLGATFGVGATGSLAGALVAGRVVDRLGSGRTVALGAVLFPAPFALTAVASGPTALRVGLLGAAEFLVGAGVMLFDISQNAIITAAVPDGMRSRVSGIYSSINYGVRPMASLVGGVLAMQLGLRAIFLIVAVGGSLSLFWFLASPIPRIATLDQIDGLRAGRGGEF